MNLKEENEKLRGLLAEVRTTFEMWKDVAPAISLCADIDKALAKQATAPAQTEQHTLIERQAEVAGMLLAPQPEMSGLVEALEKYADINNWDYDGCSVSPDVAEEALATYRAGLSAQQTNKI